MPFQNAFLYSSVALPVFVSPPVFASGLLVIGAPSRYCWLIVSLSRNQTILESGPDTTEWPDARDKITRVRGKKLTVSDAYARLIEEDLESITADYEASPGTC